MKKYSLHATDASTRVPGELQSFDSLAAACAAGIKGGVSIATDEINAGASASAIEICVEDSNSVVVSRSVITMSVCNLHID